MKGIFNNCHHNNTNIWEGTGYAPSLFVWVEYGRKEEHKGGHKNETHYYICGISGIKSNLQRNKGCKRVRLWRAYFYKKIKTEWRSSY